MLKIFDRYIGRQIVFTTVFAVVVLSAVLVLGQVFKRLIVQLDRYPELGWQFVVEFMANVMPYSLIFTIPWGFLTAILLIYGRLSADNEFTALRMSGLSTPRICAPVFLIALVLTMLTLWMNVEVAPRSKSRIAQIFFELATENPAALFVSDEVVSTLPGYIIYVEERELTNEETNEYGLKNLQLVKLSERKRPEMFVRADTAIIGFAPGEAEDLFVQMDQFQNEQSTAVEAKGFLEIQPNSAQEATLQLSLEELRQKHRKDRPSYMTVSELRAEMGRHAGDKLKQSTLLTEIHKRFSLSMACVTFCLVGIPLGVTAQRRETSIGFALSLIIGVTYFLFIVIAEFFHENPSAFPHLLIWIPNVIFVTLGLLLFLRLSSR